MNLDSINTHNPEFARIISGWDKLFIEMGYVDIVNLETSIGKLTFRIVKVTDEGYYAQIDDESSQLNDRYTQLKDALEELDRGNSHRLYLYISKESAQLSLKLMRNI